jgi:hypothetical protein
MNPTITLTDKQQTAFNKRITGQATAESLATTIVTEQAQAWADSDYLAASNELVSKLKDQPQAVLDGLISQLSKIP